MHGFEFFKPLDGSIASGASMGTFCQILGAEVINIRVATCASAHNYTIQVSASDTTASFLPLKGDIGDGTAFNTVRMPTSVGGYIWDLGHLGCGMKYMRVESDATCDSGHSMTIYNIR